jgi:hypothetical protein
MTTPESYRPDDSASSPAPPKLPEPPPERFQFSLRQLLLFMFASALVAAALRQLVHYVEALPDQDHVGLVNVVLCGLTFGGLLYFFLRVPFLAARAGRFRQRWRQIQKHRRELAAWGEARKRERDTSATDVPPVE